MNHAELAGTSHKLWQDMAFLKEITDTLKEFLQDAFRVLDRVNFAAAEGKALDQFNEGLIGLHIEAQISLDESSVLLNHGEHEVHVRVVTSASLSPGVRFQIHRMMAAVNLRYGTNMRAEFVNRQKERIGQGR